MKKAELSPPRTVAEGIADVLREVRLSLDQSTLASEEVRLLLQSVENSAPEATTFAGLSQRLTQLRDEITAKQKLAEEISRRVNQLAESQVEHDRYTPDALRALKARLADTLDNHDEFWKQWLAQYAQALADWRVDVCSQLVELPFPNSISPFAALFRAGTEALQTNNFAQATGMLSRLASGHFGAEAATPAAVRALLNVLLSRIHIREKDFEGARADAERARALAPKDGRTLAALGHIALETPDPGDDPEAERLFIQAIELSPTLPDGYREMGMLSESRQQWRDAERWYTQSFDTSATAVEALSSLNRLLAPVTGLLYYTLAERLRQCGRLEATYSAVARALELGVPDAVQSSERDPYLLKAHSLETLASAGIGVHEIRETAQAYLASGKQRYWAKDYKTAQQRFQRAIDLEPKEVVAYWYLADTIRLQSVLPNFPYIEPNLSKKARAIWTAGETIRLPRTAEESWAYIVRGRIGGDWGFVDKSIQDCNWEQLAYLECGTFYLTDQTRLTEIARAYRSLVDSVALKTMDRAAHLAGGNVDKYSLGTRASILINLGHYEAASKILDELLTQDTTDTSADSDVSEYPSWQALTYLMLHQFARGVEQIKRYPDDDVNPWRRKLRGDLMRFSGNLADARRDFEWLWNRRDESTISPECPAWSAYHLGFLEESLARAKPLTNIPQMASDAWLLSGLVEVARGRPKDALQSFSASVTAAFTLNDIASLELDLERIGHEWYTQHKSGYRDLTSALDARRSALAPERINAIGDLQKLLAKPGTDPGTWRWIAAQATLGRLSVEAELGDVAGQAYTALAEFPEKFPAAQAALDRIRANQKPRAQANA